MLDYLMDGSRVRTLLSRDFATKKWASLLQETSQIPGIIVVAW